MVMNNTNKESEKAQIQRYLREETCCCCNLLIGFTILFVLQFLSNFAYFCQALSTGSIFGILSGLFGVIAPAFGLFAIWNGKRSYLLPVQVSLLINCIVYGIVCIQLAITIILIPLAVVPGAFLAVNFWIFSVIRRIVKQMDLIKASNTAPGAAEVNLP